MTSEKFITYRKLSCFPTWCQLCSAG